MARSSSKAAVREPTLEATTPVNPIPVPDPSNPMFATLSWLNANGVASAQQLSDASAVYNEISANPLITRTSLIAWATGLGATVDRLNAALGVLLSLGLVASMP